MLRLADDARTDVRLERGELTTGDVDRLAEHIAAFHARCAQSPEISSHGAIDSLTANVTENFEAVRGDLRVLAPADAAGVEAFQLGVLRERGALIEKRRAAGLVRDGHGDLRLEHVYFGDDGGITILDCIEFADRYRCADVCADIAFLSMDLEAHGRVDLAERLLARYARATDDYDLYALVDLFESYRAWVRGKVALLVAKSAADDRLRARAEQDARKHLVLALAKDRASLLAPVVVAVGGIIASGKSTIADALAERLSAPVVDADRTRKSMLGVAHRAEVHASAFEGPYDPRFTDAVYDEVMRRADVVLTSGRPVVLDASFRTADLRRRARDLAARHGVPFLHVACHVPEDVCLARLERREQEGGVSDGRRAIFADFVARVEPPDEVPPGELLALDTSAPVATSLATLEAHLRTWPARFRG
jgi:predicted kinase